MTETSIAVVDDHPLLKRGVGVLFGQDSGYSLVASGSKAADVCLIMKQFCPDVLIVDLNMPGDAFRAISDSSRLFPKIKILVFTASDSTEDVTRALESGAKAFVQKGGTADELLEAIETVLRDETYISPCFAVKVIKTLQNREFLKKESGNAKLNVREEQIIRLLFCGKKNFEIARELYLSENTIKSYMSALMRKLNARNRLEIVITARKLFPSSFDLTIPHRKAVSGA